MRGLFRSVMLCAALGPATASAKTIDASTSAQPPPPPPSVSKASAAINADSPRLLSLFRELRTRPGETRAAARKSARIAAELAGQGFEVRLGRAGTRVVATLRNGAGPTLVYRTATGTDPDASSAQRAERRAEREDSSSEPAPSQAHGDPENASAAWLLGMAKAISLLRADWAGTLVLVSEASRREDDPETPASERDEDDPRLPSPDVVLSLGASSAPFGSILGVRGRRRPGTDAVDISLHRLGVYQSTPYLDSGRELATATIQHFGIPDDATFGYVLVGIADPSLVGDAPSVLESAPFAEDAAVPLDLGAIPLGAKVATVAVLELLDRPTPRPSAPASQWTIHQY